MGVRAAAIVLVLATVLFGTAPARAQDYPNRNITIMCGFAAGGGGDLICRYIADRLSGAAGQRALVENRVGALGSIAAAATSHSKPDGYTLLVTPGSATHASYNYMFIKPLYDPIKDFTMVTTIARLTFILVVAPDKMPVTSVKELTEWSKTHQAKTGGSTVTGQVSTEIYKQMAGVDALWVPYKSAQQTVLDLIAGDLDYMFCDPGLAMTQIPTGALRPLALTSSLPSTAIPGIPRMADVGFPGYDVTGWWAAYVAPGTPAPIVAKLKGWIDEIVLRQETKDFFARAGIDTFPAGNLDLAKFTQDETAKWKKHFEIAKIPPQ